MLKHFTLFLIILTIFPSVNFAQSQEGVPVITYSGTPRKYEIADIEVTGIQNYDPKILVNLSGLVIGQKLNVPGEEISEAIRKYWQHGLFSNVKIKASKIEGGKVWLEIELQERPRLSEINYYGLKKSEIETISEKVAMMKGSQVTPYLITRSEKYITDHFVAKGFYNTEVRVVQKDDTTKANNVYLDITVDKKEKVKVKNLDFTGNTVFKDGKLNRIMKKTNEKGKILNFFRTKKFINETYKEDLIAIIDKYNELGYRDMVIDYDSITRNDDNTVNIKINIEEGRKYYLGNITWIGNSIYPGEFLGAVLRLKKGDVFNQKLMDERLSTDDDAVSSLYMNNGYLFSNIQPVEINVYGDTIDLEMRVYEGKQATINNIVINGNTKTHEHVVRREIRTKPGQLFSKEQLIRTIRELSQLGHFNPENIQPDVQPNPEDGTVDLVYNLEEKANDQIELSGGWGAGMFVGSLGLKFSNFSVRNIFNKEAWRPLPTGDGQTLSLRAQTNGAFYQSYSFSFTEPWLGGKRPNSLTVSAYRSIQSNVSDSYRNSFNRGYGGYGGGGYGSGYDNYNPNAQYDASQIDQHMKISGLSVGFGKRLTWPDDWFSIYAEMSYQHYDLRDWVYFIMQNGVSQNLHFKLMLSRNSIDNPLYTRSGSNFSVGVEFTPPYSAWIDKDYKGLYDLTINGDETTSRQAQEQLYDLIEYHKWTTQGSIFTPLDKGNKLVLMGKFEMGFLGYYNKNVRSPYEKFMLGGDGMSGYSMYGSQTVGLRGYENSSLTPRNQYGSYDGNMYNKLTMELRYPLTLQPSAQVYMLTFLEAGNAWSDFQDYSPFDLKRSAGVGVRIFLPIFGLMGIDWGYGFDGTPAQPKTPSGSQFHFVIGQQF